MNRGQAAALVKFQNPIAVKNLEVFTASGNNNNNRRYFSLYIRSDRLVKVILLLRCIFFTT